MCGYVSQGVWICVTRCVSAVSLGGYVSLGMCVSSVTRCVDMCHQVCGNVSLGVCQQCH